MDDYEVVLVKMLEARQKRIFELTTKIEMTTSLFEEVVERTGNFREGFYSSKKIHELGKSASKQLQKAVGEATAPDDAIHFMDEFIQALENTQATIMSEIDRIERMS